MRTHEEFCEEINRRKDRLIMKKRKKRKTAISCISFVFCLGILASVILTDRLSPDAIPECYLSPPESGEAEQLKISLPTDEKYACGTEELTVVSPADAEKILKFVEANNGAFRYVYSDIISSVTSEVNLDGMPPVEEMVAEEAIEEGLSNETSFVANSGPLPTDNISIGDMFLITVTMSGGTTVQYALDANKHPRLARELEEILMDIKK